MNTTIKKALVTREAHALLARGLKLISTERQLANGTIVLAGRIKKQDVSYKITASGAVLSNEFVARQANGNYPLDQYRRGLKAAHELFTKRFTA